MYSSGADGRQEHCSERREVVVIPTPYDHAADYNEGRLCRRLARAIMKVKQLSVC
jgi:hypothetical protein